MRDTTLYQHLLGLTEPWSVTRVDLDVATQRVDVWVEHPKSLQWACPECGAQGSLHDHASERVWRHLDSCQFQTFLHAAPPRVKCPEHGVRQVRLPWTEPNARFTSMFEAFAIRVLQETSIQAARKILGISWDEAWYLQHRAVARGLARKKPRDIRYLGVDEKSAGRGQKNYVTVICDLIKGTVEEVTEGREKRSLLDYLEALPDEQRDAIAAVSMDMCDAYIYAVLDGLADGQNKIVFDRFHIMQHMGKAVDAVRRQEHYVLSKKGDSPLAGVPATSGSTPGRTSPLGIGRTSTPSRTPTSKRRGPGRSRKTYAISGTTRPCAGLNRSGNAGTSGRATAASSQSRRPRRPSKITCTGS